MSDHGHHHGRERGDEHTHDQVSVDGLEQVDVGADHGDAWHGHHGHQDHGHGGVRGLVRSLVRSHTHDPVESVDPELQASAEGIRALGVSLVVLAATAVVQVVVVAVSGSVALLSDTVHNFIDALTALPLGVAFWLSRRPPTRRYTYGYGRAEDLAGVFIVVTVAASCGLAGWEAVNRLVHPHHVHNLGWVIVAGVAGFAGNELVAVYRIRVGRRIGSAALVADGLHARTDGFTSLAVVVGAIGVALVWQLADPIVGLAITAAIVTVVKNAAGDIWGRLMDAVDPELVDQVHAALAGVEGVEAVETVRIRWMGHQLRAEAEITSAGALSLAEAHDVAEQAHHRLLHRFPVWPRPPSTRVLPTPRAPTRTPSPPTTSPALGTRRDLRRPTRSSQEHACTVSLISSPGTPSRPPAAWMTPPTAATPTALSGCQRPAWPSPD